MKCPISNAFLQNLMRLYYDHIGQAASEGQQKIQPPKSLPTGKKVHPLHSLNYLPSSISYFQTSH